MEGFKFIDEEDTEDTFAHDESDIQEEEIKYYDEHFWCKDKDKPVGFTYKSKKQDFIKASENIKSNFKNSAKGSLKHMDNLDFRILDCRNRDSGPEMDIEITKSKDRGVAVLKFYGPNAKTGECTLMINKSKRYDVKFVKILAEDVIKKMLDTFISGEGWNKIFKKSTIGSSEEKKQFICPSCNKVFKSAKNLSIHTEKFHTKNNKSCTNCGYQTSDQKSLVEHKKEHASKNKEYELEEIANIVDESDFTKQSQNMLKEHKENHTVKEYVCGNCYFTTKSETEVKEHIKDLHTLKNVEQNVPSDQQEEMDIDEACEEISNEKERKHKEKEKEEEEERKRRSEMQDKKILENMKKREEEDKRIEFEKQEAERKRMEVQKQKQEEEKIERRKRKSSIKQEKKKMKRKLNKFPPNVTEIPQNIKHLVNDGDLQLLVPPDGACAPNAGAAHLFKDTRYGPNFRMNMNNFIADRWHYYQDKISFPYIRKIGVKGDVVKFELGEEKKFLQFLRTQKAAFLWSDSEDLHVMSNLYQMRIKVITVKGPQDPHPQVNWIEPDPELNAFKLLPEGNVHDMTLLHYDDLHYNLVIAKDDHIAKFGVLSETEIVLEKQFKDIENVTIQEDTFDEENRNSQKIIEKLKERVKILENELDQKSIELKEAIEIIEHADEFETVKKKKNGEDKKSQNLSKELRDCQTSKKNIENEYFQCEKELRIKTEELEKCKIEIKDLRTIVDLRKQLNERENEKPELETPSNKVIIIEENSKSGKVVRCQNCEYVTETQYQLRRHINTKHDNQNTPIISQTEDEFNCNDCDFQTTSETYLKKHIEIKHLIKCKLCEGEFKDKKTFMQHRKKEHYSSVAPCNKFAENSCPFVEDTCWWSHKAREISSEKLHCFICGKSFNSKMELMRHRKKEHLHLVKECTKYKNGKCGFQNDFCWFKHTLDIDQDRKNVNEESIEDEMEIENEDEKSTANNLVFHGVQRKPKPPLEETNKN